MTIYPVSPTIEIVTWYECNTQCVFCSARAMQSQALSTEEIAVILKRYRAEGFASVSFGGGEPAVRDDLPAVIRIAKSLGYTGIAVKTNGIRFCYPEYLAECLDAGATHFSVSLWGGTPAVHDLMAGINGAFDMTVMALKHMIDAGASVAVDYLLTKHSLSTTAEAMTLLTGEVGVRAISFWLYSVFGGGGSLIHQPRISEAAFILCEAVGKCLDNGVTFSTSHIMPCLLGDLAEIYYNIKDIDLTVITRGSIFKAEESPFEKGRHTAPCRRCFAKTYCTGPRPEYTAVFGSAEFNPMIAANNTK